MKFQGAIKFSLRFDIIVQNLSEGNMKNFIFLWLLLVGYAFGADKDDPRVSASQQAESNLSQPNFEIFYDENASDAQIDAGLDALLEFAAQNRGRIDEDFGEFGERIFTPFIANMKLMRSGKLDFTRITRILAFKPDLNYNEGYIGSPLQTAISYGCPLDFGAGIDAPSSADLGADEKNLITPSEKLGRRTILKNADVLRLVRFLVEHGANIHARGSLHLATSCGDFETFSLLLELGATDISGVVSSVAGGELLFLRDAGFIVSAYKNLPDPSAREFINSARFKKFRDGRLRYVEEILKFQSLRELPQNELTGLIKLAAVLDDTDTAEFLLSRGLCKQKELCEFLKVQAKTYDAVKISKILSRQKG